MKNIFYLLPFILFILVLFEFTKRFYIQEGVCNVNPSPGMVVVQNECSDLPGQISDTAKVNSYAERLDNLKTILIPLLNLYNNPQLKIVTEKGETGSNVAFEVSISEPNYDITYENGLSVDIQEVVPQTITVVVPKGDVGDDGPYGRKGDKGEKGPVGLTGPVGLPGLFIQ